MTHEYPRNPTFDSVTESRVRALEGFGFTQRQREFIVAVMVHSGCFLERQYCAFTSKACDVSRSDVRALIEGIADADAPILANRVLALVSKMFEFSVARDWRSDNPAKGVERPGTERPRERVLSDDEIRTLWKVLEGENPFFRALFQLRLLTAARGGEIRCMRWSDVDLASGWWTIPREHSKNNEPHRVPLTQQSQHLLKELQVWQKERLQEINEGRKKKRWELKSTSHWVFPSPKGDGPFEWEQRAAARIRRESGIDFRPHDLRRTVATGLTQHCGVDRFILKRILNPDRRQRGCSSRLTRAGLSTLLDVRLRSR